MNSIKIVEKELSYQLGGIFFVIQNEYGRFCKERQYGDVFAIKLQEISLPFQKEVSVEIGGRKSNFIDFVICGRIIVELKAKPFLSKEDFLQVKRYLAVSGIELGLLVNFQDKYLKPRRILNTNLKTTPS